MVPSIFSLARLGRDWRVLVLLRSFGRRLGMTSLGLVLGILCSIDIGLSKTIPLTNLEFFHRCYSQITGLRAPSTHPELGEILNNGKNPIDSCIDVLRKARFVNNGLISNTSDPEALAVLEQFKLFLISWFDSRDFQTAPLGHFSAEHTRQMDRTSSALYLLHALFGPGVNYDSVVRHPAALDAQRSNAVSGPKTQLGTMFGVRSFAADDRTWFSRNGTAFTTMNVVFTSETEDFFRSYGGGILGENSHLWRNTGIPDIRDVIDGGVRMHRRLTSRVFSELLCRQAPYLRASDVNAMVVDYKMTYPPAQQILPFRASTACARCHAAQDQLSASFRNIRFRRSYDNDFNSNGINPESPDRFLASAVIPANGASDPVPLHLIQEDLNFNQRRPEGTLFYRDYKGDLIDIDVPASNQEEALVNLGTILSQRDDLYVCAASRFFEFFTGIKANLLDPGDPQNPVITEEETTYKNIVINLGLSLKNHQSLEQLMREIMSLDLYRYQDMRD